MQALAQIQQSVQPHHGSAADAQAQAQVAAEIQMQALLAQAKNNTLNPAHLQRLLADESTRHLVGTTAAGQQLMQHIQPYLQAVMKASVPQATLSNNAQSQGQAASQSQNNAVTQNPTLASQQRGATTGGRPTQHQPQQQQYLQSAHQQGRNTQHAQPMRQTAAPSVRPPPPPRSNTGTPAPQLVPPGVHNITGSTAGARPIAMDQMRGSSISFASNAAFMAGFRPQIEPPIDYGEEILSRHKVRELVKSIDEKETIEEDVAVMMSQIAGEFLEQVVEMACKLAKHRGSDTLEPKDLQLVLERYYSIRVPGFADFAARDLAEKRRAAPSQPHTAKAAVVQKAIKQDKRLR
ncbi:Transcription initiation factor TFIID subunit 12 [Gonapodya sp. JEL0774]|nr:Transcription initiation factor TFIID subunit 12 [Gonapodya sp. JEL0774]